MNKVKKSKNQLRREKQKLKKTEDSTTTSKIEIKQIESVDNPINNTQISNLPNDFKDITNNSHSIDSTNGKIFESELDKLMEIPEYQQFKHVFDKFQAPDEPVEDKENQGDIIESDEDIAHIDSDNDQIDNNHNNDDDKTVKMSKKQLRKLNKLSLSELKSKAKFPELIQWYDVDSKDPLLTIQIKQKKNALPVPSHWQFKREYLSNKRGFEKKPFQLPSYILDTGILNMRDTTKEDESTLKQKSREKVQPKLNRLDLDYQKLHDAFFKFQTKPRLFKFGDLYYEGRELDEFDFKDIKPGKISKELQDALNLPQGIIYPWVAKMKHYGPPPSYPGMKIPGYNVDVEIEQVDEVLNNEIIENDEPFGKLLSYEDESEEEEEEEEGSDDDENVIEPGYEENRDSEDEEGPIVVNQQVDNNIDDDDGDDGNIDDIPLPEVEQIDEEDQQTDIEPKKLYQILKAKFINDQESSNSNNNGGAGILNTGLTYELPQGNNSKRKNSNDNNKEDNLKKSKIDDNQDDEEKEEGKFKF